MPQLAGTDAGRVRWLHERLTRRGWTLSAHDADDVDHCGYPLSGQPLWEFPGSFGGEVCQEIDDVAPERAACLYTLGAVDEFDSLIIVAAGAHCACREHGKTQHTLPLDPDTEQLDAALAAAEAHAGSLDIRALIECRFFGPCGHAWNRAR